MVASLGAVVVRKAHCLKLGWPTDTCCESRSQQSRRLNHRQRDVQSLCNEEESHASQSEEAQRDHGYIGE